MIIITPQNDATLVYIMPCSMMLILLLSTYIVFVYNLNIISPFLLTNIWPAGKLKIAQYSAYLPHFTQQTDFTCRETKRGKNQEDVLSNFSIPMWYLSLQKDRKLIPVCSTLVIIEQWGFFSVPQLPWHGTSSGGSRNGRDPVAVEFLGYWDCFDAPMFCS